ncbi:hypothetical protein [Zooshikella sp. RANM57]|uniref:hypothetical protein n=1 Tax=Zooshikella sp. RANM57 TaxID=3425863 RepID=UPI003D6FA226
MKRYLLGLSLLVIVNCAFADLAGRWTLEFDYGCNGSSKIERYEFNSDGSWRSIDEDNVYGTYLDYRDMIILIFHSSPGAYPTTYAGNKESFTRYKGVMRNWNGSAGCFTLTKHSNLGLENQIEEIEN